MSKSHWMYCEKRDKEANLKHICYLQTLLNILTSIWLWCPSVSGYHLGLPPAVWDIFDVLSTEQKKYQPQKKTKCKAPRIAPGEISRIASPLGTFWHRWLKTSANGTNASIGKVRWSTKKTSQSEGAKRGETTTVRTILFFLGGEYRSKYLRHFYNFL